ncbi:MAG: hypothetical protein H7A04_12620 [Pseudomonadales bacterium]|nr:hypothetical protein [Pseudomonadales bacterium]
MTQSTAISLKTNDKFKRLDLSDFEKYSCHLDVQSGAFLYSGRFYFDNLRLFAKQCSALYKSLKGEAVLNCDYEDPYIRMKITDVGHLVVEGLLVEYGDYSQELKFSFCTDQTSLEEFSRGIRKQSEAVNNQTKIGSS